MAISVGQALIDRETSFPRHAASSEHSNILQEPFETKLGESVRSDSSFEGSADGTALVGFAQCISEGNPTQETGAGVLHFHRRLNPRLGRALDKDQRRVQRSLDED